VRRLVVAIHTSSATQQYHTPVLLASDSSAVAPLSVTSVSVKCRSCVSTPLMCSYSDRVLANTLDMLASKSDSARALRVMSSRSSCSIASIAWPVSNTSRCMPTLSRAESTRRFTTRSVALVHTSACTWKHALSTCVSSCGTSASTQRHHGVCRHTHATRSDAADSPS
jgi:hypothetical protein